MSLAALSVKRPVFVTSMFFLILGLGVLSYTKLSTELYPDVSFPVVNIVVPFPGAAPEEVENQISKPLENALSGLAQVRSIRSRNIEGAGIVTAIFSMDSDVRTDEQNVQQILARVKSDFPGGILEPSVRTIDPSDVPLFTLGLTADMPEDRLFDLVEHEIRPRLQQIPHIGLVEIEGGRKREIEVEVDRNRIRDRQMTVGEIVERLGKSGMNIPSGEIEGAESTTLVRSMGQFGSLAELGKLPVRFVGNEGITRLSDVATIKEGLTDERNRVYVNGVKALALKVYRQKGGDTAAISKDLDDEMRAINSDYRPKIKNWNLAMAHDGTKPIRAGVNEAKLAIEIGVVLTILVVFFFLGSVRSTFITGIALPNSLFGAFLLMWVAHFSLNITSLAALSLAVGLLVDDAIVVRESIFKRLEAGDEPYVAAVDGTKEVTLAVVATTLTVLSVFGPIAFLNGIIGQFFKQFGLTVCFAMLISLLDSLTVAPMLSAYFAGRGHGKNSPFVAAILAPFDRYQAWQERTYLRVLNATQKRPLTLIAFAVVAFLVSLLVFNSIPKSFAPPAGAGEFQVILDAPPDSTLAMTDQLASKVDQLIRSRKDVERTVLTIGGNQGEQNLAQILVLLNDHRSLLTGEVKEEVRQQIAKLGGIHASVQDILDIGGGAGQPYTVNITGQDLDAIRAVSERLMTALKKSGDVKDVDTSYRTSAAELRIGYDSASVEELGVSTVEVGQELRLMLSGYSPARFHDGGEEYDIKVRLRPDQQDLAKDYDQVYIPNLNHRLIPLKSVAHVERRESPLDIRRENRKRYIEVSADIDPHGKGLSNAIELTKDLFASNQIQAPPGVSYEFSGQTRDFQDFFKNALMAVGLSIGFMYLVLASLYESFIIPFNIMLVLPLAVCGAFYALKLTGLPYEMNAVIGCILLLGVSAKNSILLVDHIQEALKKGVNLKEAILDAGKSRLRPIMMTSFALIAGMLPVAIPLEEAARARMGMAITVIGGIITSTLLTIVVIPAAYPYFYRLQKKFALKSLT